MALEYVPGDPYWPADRQRIFSRPIELSSRTLGWRGILVEHYHSQPDSFSSPGLLSHLIALHIGPPIHNTHWQNGHEIHEVLHDGEMHIFPAASYRRSQMHDPSEDVFIGLDTQFFADTITALGINPSRVEVQACTQLADAFIAEMGRALYAEVRRRDQSAALMAESLANALVVHLVRNYSTHTSELRAPQGKLSDVRLKQTIDYIDANLDRDLSLDELAGTAGLSASHFHTLFKRSTGQSPHQYVIAQRVKRAERLLLGSVHSIAAVSAAVGFADQSHLTRHLRRQLGVTPAQLRAR